MHPLRNSSRFLIVVGLLLAGCAGSKYGASEQAVRVVFFGDSITEQGARPGGYVTMIRDSLQRRGTTAEIIGAGVSGNKVEQLLARMDRDVIARKPTAVVIYIGINDVWHWTIGIPNAKGSTKEEFEKGLNRIITGIRAAGSNVVLCTPSVIGEKAAGQNAEDAMLDEYSAISRKVARETGVELCDLRKAFMDYLVMHNPENREKGILTTDRVHLNAEGNRLVAGEMLRTLDGAGLLGAH